MTCNLIGQSEQRGGHEKRTADENSRREVHARHPAGDGCEKDNPRPCSLRQETIKSEE